MKCLGNVFLGWRFLESYWMKMFLVSVMLSFSVAFVANTSADESDWLYDLEAQTVSFDQREITYYIDRPVSANKVPLLIVIDGSGCAGQMRSTLQALFRPGPLSKYRFARLRVEKPGVQPDSKGEVCSDVFRRFYTINNRVNDHLRVLSRLDAAADWWNGDLYVWGWSDGGDIAAQLTLFRPDVDRAVFGAVGGGLTFKTLFEDYWACPEDRESHGHREECLNALRQEFAAIESNPTWNKTWGGEDNSWRVWEDRLNRKLVAPLSDLNRPFLIVHGAKDYDSVPVESARLLADLLHENGNEYYSYWEIACMGHSWLDLPQTAANELQNAMLDWLLSEQNTSSSTYEFDLHAKKHECASQ